MQGGTGLPEAVAVGVPDALRGEVVKAYVVLRAGYAPIEVLAAELEVLPKTPNGKFQCFVLRQQ